MGDRFNRFSLDTFLETDIVFGSDAEDRLNNPVVKIYSGSNEYVVRKVEEDSQKKAKGAYATLVITDGEKAGYSLITIPYGNSVDDFVRYISLAEKKILEQNRFDVEEINRTLRITFRDKNIENKAKYITQEDKFGRFRDYKILVKFK
ncbi:hypothetical protein KY342_06035 [Candidatus Woesearchaeota archaeon]|nr:hypothetical protein [Candidatus Woesearchaeota archaeon]